MGPETFEARFFIGIDYNIAMFAQPSIYLRHLKSRSALKMLTPQLWHAAVAGRDGEMPYVRVPVAH